MAYTIVKSNGTTLTTIADGTINTTSTSLGLPGRNYAGYGQTLDTNFVHILENFADTTPPANPLQGQLWYNTSTGTLLVCPTDGESNAAAWLTLTATASGGTTTFGSVSVTGNIVAGNVYANSGTVGANLGSFFNLTVSNLATLGNITSTGTANLGNVVTTTITTGSNVTPGTLTGIWSVNGGSGNAIILNDGNLFIGNSAGANVYGIKTDKYMYANGDAISFAGTYSNSNVQNYLPNYGGVVYATTANVGTGGLLTTGGNSAAGTITGNWTLSSGSRLQATYADLAERFESDTDYDPGTVVELGGEKEITAVKFELSDDIFGVISNTAAYLMNSGAGDDKTHPPVAVSGRVQVKVTGKVKKGDRLVSAGNGIARAASKNEATAFNTIGRSLINKLDDEVGYVEAIVSIR